MTWDFGALVFLLSGYPFRRLCAHAGRAAPRPYGGGMNR